VVQHASTPLECVHGDLCGPVTPTSPSANAYFLFFVGDYSRFMWVALLPTKAEAPNAIKRIKAAVELERGHKLRVLRTDHGGGFTVASLNDYYIKLGVRHELTAPYPPQQNGIVERQNQTMVAMVPSMLKAKNLPRTFWGEAICTVVYILNKTSCKGINGKTPFELWYGRTPAVHHLRMFGCVVHDKNTKPHLKKLKDRSKPIIFVGYEPRSKAYRAYDPTAKRVVISHDIIFDEEACWQWGESSATVPAMADQEDFTDFVVEYSTTTVDDERAHSSTLTCTSHHASVGRRHDNTALHENAPLRATGVGNGLSSKPRVRDTAARCR
jgi:hypothetical protein